MYGVPQHHWGPPPDDPPQKKSHAGVVIAVAVAIIGAVLFGAAIVTSIVVSNDSPNSTEQQQLQRWWDDTGYNSLGGVVGVLTSPRCSEMTETSAPRCGRDLESAAATAKDSPPPDIGNLRTKWTKTMKKMELAGGALQDRPPDIGHAADYISESSLYLERFVTEFESYDISNHPSERYVDSFYYGT